MNEMKLTKLAVKLRKAYRSAFFCCVLIIMTLMLIVMVGIMTGQPVDQQALAEAWTPLIIFMAVITGLCHMFHSHIMAKLKVLQKGR